MENYVTLLNSLYLPQLIALNLSLDKNIKNYKLWVLCVDDYTFNSLKLLKLKNINLIKLSEIENEILLKIKKTRTIGEYCWTLTPFSIKYVFD